MRVETYSHCDLGELEVRLTIKRLIDENKMLSQFNDPDVQNQLMFSCELIVNGSVILPVRRTRFMKKLLYDEPIIFNYKYRDLAYNSIVAINIWSTGKSYDQEKPLGSSVFSLFDDNLKLREGKYHLLIWPDRKADTSVDSTTPGLTADRNIRELNYVTDRVDYYERSSKNVKIDNRSEETLKLKLLYTYKLIPAAFLEIQLPSFNYPVYFTQAYAITPIEPRLGKSTDDTFDETILFNDPDYDKKLPDPLQELFFYFVRQTTEGNQQQTLPNKEELMIMESISNKPQTIELKPHQKLLFFKFRYALCSNKKFLVSFLHSVQWTNQRQEQQALSLLKRWARIDRDDALHLLSSSFSANKFYGMQRPQGSMKVIREYATTIIGEASNKDLSEIMLQLVQALRYEDSQSSLASMLIEKGTKNVQIGSLLFWYIKAESEQVPNVKQTELAQEMRVMYANRLVEFQKTLEERSADIFQVLLEQQRLVVLLRDLSKHIKSMKKDMDKKKQQLRKKLMEIDWSIFENLRFPLNVQETIILPIKSDCTIFSSAMAPFKLAFEGIVTTQSKKIQFIYKSGDDLRQDQLILQMFSLMDSLLKGVNQDYKLIPYKALACSKLDGFVEFVPFTKTIQQILKTSSLSEYLLKLANPHCPIYRQLFKKSGNPPPMTEKFIADNQQVVASIIMDNYILSCSGYCAITYFFGIGDRHLENLLINDCGQIFHIDFGFILGKDPKPYPPPIKLSKQMAEAMGGRDSENFTKFKFKCIEAYLYLRRYSKLITNLFELMMDSGIKDLSMDTMNGLYQKFCLDMNDNKAQEHFLLILQASLSAVFAGINDRIHKWASYWR